MVTCTDYDYYFVRAICSLALANKSVALQRQKQWTVLVSLHESTCEIFMAFFRRYQGVVWFYTSFVVLFSFNIYSLLTIIFIQKEPCYPCTNVLVKVTTIVSNTYVNNRQPLLHMLRSLLCCFALVLLFYLVFLLVSTQLRVSLPACTIILHIL